jgi:hypothetical protein
VGPFEHRSAYVTEVLRFQDDGRGARAQAAYTRVMERDTGDDARRRRPRRLVWNPPEDAPRQRSLAAHARVYAALAAVVVVFGVVTGGSFLRAIGYAVAVFVLATAWTAWRLHRTSRDGDRPGGRA